MFISSVKPKSKPQIKKQNMLSKFDKNKEQDVFVLSLSLFFLKAPLLNPFYKSSVCCYLSSLIFFFFSLVQDSVGGV